MERTKILFGNDNRFDQSGSSTASSTQQQQQQAQHRKSLTKRSDSNENGAATNGSGAANGRSPLLDLLRAGNTSISRQELINALRSCSRVEINMALASLIPTQDAGTATTATGTESTATLTAGGTNSSNSSSMSSLSASKTTQQQQQQQAQQKSAEAAKNDVSVGSGKHAIFSSSFFLLKSRPVCWNVTVILCL